MEIHDLEKPQEALIITEKLVEVQQLHSHLAKQAEQRTTLLSKVQNQASVEVWQMEYLSILCHNMVGFIIFSLGRQIRAWLQQHEEMIKSSKTWMAEAQSWLAAPCTYTRAKCLASHVHALQVSVRDLFCKQADFLIHTKGAWH